MSVIASESEIENDVNAYAVTRTQDRPTETDELSTSDLDDVDGGLMPLVLFGYGYLLGRGIRSVVRNGF